MNTTDYTQFYEDLQMGSIITVNKDLNWTSFDVVNKIKRMFRLRKVGHAGTLDPKATGLLIIATGPKTKEIDSFMNLEKEYTGSMHLGAETASFDTETEIISEKSVDHLSEIDLTNAAKTFMGEIDQIPPMHSALRYAGKRLYKFARAGEEVKREPRRVTISKFDVSDIELPFANFDIICSKGTYIRSLVSDFGKLLGVGAYLKSLTRIRIGGFNLIDSYKISDLENIYRSLK
jgi:tRNA pseudouridine55 synthase